MKVQQFVKGLLMALMSVFVTMFATSPVDYTLGAVSAIGAILVYTGQNLISVLHSDSEPGELTFVNALSGIFIAVGNGLVSGFAMYIFDGAVHWNVLWPLVISITCTYLGTTFFAPPHTDVSNKKLFKSSPKSYYLILGFLFMPGLLNAQGPFDGILKLSKQNDQIVKMLDQNATTRQMLAEGKIRADDVVLTDHKWLLRLATGVKGFQVTLDPDSGEPVKKAFDELAFGVGYQKYKDVGGTAVNTLGFNLLFFFDDATFSNMKLKNAVTLHYWQILDIGIGRNWTDKYWFALTGVTYSF